MDLFKEVALVAMSGWNLPDGCTTNDLPGNTKEDEKRDAISSLVEIAQTAVEESIEHIVNYRDYLEFDGETTEEVKGNILRAIFDEAQERV